MTKSDKEGRWLMAMGAVACVVCIIMALNASEAWIGSAFYFLAGLMLGLVAMIHGAMSHRRFWNNLYGRDLWDKDAQP